MREYFLLITFCLNIFYLNASEITSYELNIVFNNGITLRTKSQRPIESFKENIEHLEFNSKPVEKYIYDETVLKKIEPGKDGRTLITNTHDWPNSVHGVVKVKFPNKSKYGHGSGILISPYIVLTAAHNLYNYSKKEEAEEIIFIPAKNGTEIYFGQHTAARCYYPEEYKKNEIEDYGIIFLNTPIGQFTGYFGIEISPNEKVKNLVINVTGYPGDKVKNMPGHHQMWTMAHKPDVIDNNRIHYRIDTFFGQSGSGVFHRDNKDYYVVGVHFKGGAKMNYAVPMTRKRYQQICHWINDFSKIKSQNNQSNKNLFSKYPQDIKKPIRSYRNSSEAKKIEYYEQAIANGNVKAKINLSNFCFRIGEDFEKQGSNIQAIEYYERAIANDNVKAKINLSNLYRKLGEDLESQGSNTQAIEYYEQAVANGNVKAKISLSNFCFRIGEDFEKQGSNTQAIEYYERAIANDNVKAKINLSNLYLKLGEDLESQDSNTQAIEYYKRAIASNDNSKASSRLAKVNNKLRAQISLNNSNKTIENKSKKRKKE